MDYAGDIGALARRHPDLASEMSGWSSLEDVMTWMQGRGLPLRSLERVAQDEYSHDVFLPLSAQGPWLVFGCT